MIEINISRVDNGHLVRAGCLTLVFNNRAELAVELTRWLENPAKVEQEYIMKYRNNAVGTLGGIDMGVEPGGVGAGRPFRSRTEGEVATGGADGCDAERPRDPRTTRT